MKTKKTTIAILATLAIGIAAAQAGRGTVLSVSGADHPQTQHANHAQHTFKLENLKSYELQNLSYTLTTMDESSTENYIVVTFNWVEDDGPQKLEKMIQLGTSAQRKTSISHFIDLEDDELIPTDGILTVHFDFQHTASTHGHICVHGKPTQNADAVGSLKGPDTTNANEHALLAWEAKISVKGNDSSPGVGNETISSQQQAPNAGKTKTNNGRGNNK